MKKDYKEYFEYVATILYLNALIKLDSLENKRNFLDDPYYRNYNRFTPVSYHKYYSFKEWQEKQ